MSPLCFWAVRRGTLFAGLILTLSPMGFADWKGNAYAGHTRCGDKGMIMGRDAYFDTFRPVLDRRAGGMLDRKVGPKHFLNPFTLGTTMTGKFGFWWAQGSVSYQTSKAAGVAGPTSFSIEKTASGSAALNVLVCSFEFVPDGKLPQTPDSRYPVAMVKETAIRVPHDALVGTKVPLLVSSTKDKGIVYLVEISTESEYFSFSYSLTTALTTALPTASK